MKYLYIVVFVFSAGCSRQACEELVVEFEKSTEENTSFIKEPYYIALPERCHEHWKEKSKR